MFCIASIWNRYSLPDRRAESPVHSSLGPRMAKSSPARWSSLATARDVFLLRSSKLPAQPTQYRYSWSNGPGAVDDLDALERARPSRPAHPGSCRRRSTSSPSSGTCCRARRGSRSP